SSITGKIELEYEGELKGAEHVAREIIRCAIGQTFMKYFGPGDELNEIIQWFDNGGHVRVNHNSSNKECLVQLGRIPRLLEKISLLGISHSGEPGLVCSGAEFILEGLCSQKK